MMKASLSLTVEALPGDSIEAVAEAMVQMADRLGCLVRLASFNGVPLVAQPGGSAERLARSYGAVLHANRGARVATSRAPIDDIPV